MFIIIEDLSITTPSILFSAISLIMLAYTNRFLAYAQLIRNLSENYKNNPTKSFDKQLVNLRKRLYLTRSMQVLGVSSLMLCVVCTLFIYLGFQLIAGYLFAISLILLSASLIISIVEVHISVKALEVHLDSMK